MNSISRCKPLLGTYVELTLSAEESDDTLIDMSIAAFSEIEKVEKLMSFHKVDSELSYINKFAHKQTCQISTETEEVLLMALQLSKLSNGLFDISIAPELIKQGSLPDIDIDINETANWKDINLDKGKINFEKAMLIDLGGIAKGYAVDKACSLFDNKVKVIINAGGDLRMSHWQNEAIHVRKPFSKNSELIEIAMQDTAIATSANYYLEGKSAIISPKTRKSINDQRSFSIFAPNCMLADGLTKIAFQSQDYDQLLNTLNAKLLIIDKHGIVK
jgi:thiamine biosynthesis lipoprotein